MNDERRLMEGRIRHGPERGDDMDVRACCERASVRADEMTGRIAVVDRERAGDDDDARPHGPISPRSRGAAATGAARKIRP
jgi:hypothetical protein